MKARLNFIVLLSIFLFVYVIMIGVSVILIVRKVNLMSLSAPQALPSQASPQPLSTPQTLVPQAPILPLQPSQQAPETRPVITANSIPSSKAIEESIEIEKQRQQMVNKMIADRRNQEALVRQAVENAPPRNKP